MRFALSLGNTTDPATMANFAALAEASGWDGVFLEDYLVYQNRAGSPTYDPIVCLAAMAMRTSRVRLGTLVTPLPRRRVAKLAAEMVALDHLSHGRITLGVGLGDPWDVALANLGEPTDTATRAALVDEGLAVLTGLWTGEPVTFEGKHVKVDGVSLLPRPVQAPRIPIWIGGQFPKPGPVKRAARWDGSCLFIPTAYSPAAIAQRDWTPDDVRTLLDRIGSLRPNGLEGFDVVVGGRERQTDWAKERKLIGSLAAAGATWWQEWIEPTDPAATEAAIGRGPLRG